MGRLIGVESAAELLRTSKNSLMVTASVYKRDNGVYPQWYVSDGNRGGSKSFVDMEVLDNNRNLIREIWLYLTDYLYWYITEDLRINVNDLATRLSILSEKFQNQKSWVSFLRSTLFTLPPDNVYAIQVSMLTEFFKHSITIARRANFKTFDWDAHSRNTQWVRVDRSSEQAIKLEEIKAVLTYC